MSQEDIDKEAAVLAHTTALIDQLAWVCLPIWHWGDGEGGEVISMLKEAIDRQRMKVNP